MRNKMAIALSVFMMCMLTGCASASTEAYENEENEQKELVLTPVVEEEQEPIPVLSTVDLMEGVETKVPGSLEGFLQTPIMKFGVPLFQNAVKGAKNDENVLVSPLSAWTVLCMVEQGAAGKTKEQMKQVLHLSESADHLTYGYQLIKASTETEECSLRLANGIWMKNVRSLHVNEEFLKDSKTYFDAAAYLAPFDNTTLQEVNRWVEEHTQGLVKEVLTEIKEEDVMYLVNALSFDAEWQNIYNETEVWQDVFTTEDGTEQFVPMLHSKETVYLEDKNATGFVKYYKGQSYAFVALLPREGLTVSEYVEELTAESLKNLFDHSTRDSVEVTMPKFAVEYGFKLNDSLQQMGMTDAFSVSDANFSQMATSDVGNIYISRVEQNCFIAVDERGTKAGAATAVAMANKMALIKNKTVVLNRPFVYLIVECDNYEPLFLGTIMNAEQ